MIRSEVAADLEPEHSREHAVVADIGVTVEWQMGGVQRDVRPRQSEHPPVRRPDNRTQPAPKHPVMDKKEIGVLLGGEPDRGLTEVDRGGEPGDVAAVRDLEAVQGFRGVGDFLSDPEVAIEELADGV
jgi:hypothetical protein